MTDEHMLEGVSCYGETPCQTPNIDALARRGMLFRNVYTACPVCAPARASLITGQHIHRHGVTANLLEMGCGDSRLADGAELLPRKLQAQGYRCGYNGKWHISEGILPTQLDVYPTICEYAGADHSKAQGRSLISFIKGRGKEIQWRDSVFVEFFGLSDCATNMVTCRHKNWKYGWTCSNKDELYDLSSDPYETKNLIGDPSYAEILFLLRKKMYTFMCESQYPGAYAFLRNVLGWNIDRQYRAEKDPLVPEDFLTDTMW